MEEETIVYSVLEIFGKKLKFVIRGKIFKELDLLPTDDLIKDKGFFFKKLINR